MALARQVMYGGKISLRMAAVSSRRGKSMMSLEDKLPNLPVPALHQTMDKYLSAVQPLLNDREFKNTLHVVEEFKKSGGIGEKLQKLLEEKAASSENWLATWWDNIAYFEYRAPVVINSSPGILFPRQKFQTDWDQYKYCAKLVHKVLDFKDLIDFEELPVEYAGKDPLTMRQFRKLLSISRIPNSVRDHQVTTPREDSRHMIVMHNNHFFVLDVYKGTSDSRLSEDELVQQFEEIVNLSPKPHPEPVGILTSQDRNTWAQGWKRLIRDPKNKANADRITKSICVICLDQPVDIPSSPAAAYEVPWKSVGLAQMLHGGGPHQNSANRWFDKTSQFIVNRNGLTGMCYEHSGAEGPPVMSLCNSIMQIEMKESNSGPPATNVGLAQPEKLVWKISTDLSDRIELAKSNMARMASDLDIRGFMFDKFGKNVPKSLKLSPDAFIQISLQLAYYRLHGHMAPSYESCSIRRFKMGRTENIRQSSMASKSFCLSADNSKVSLPEKRELLLKAIEDHAQYTKECSMFRGIDRHLLGLKLTALENGIALPEFFRDKGYAYSFHFKISTSQVPSPYDACLCFGPVVPDGYGVCYNPMDSAVNFAVSAFHSHPKTSVNDLGEMLSAALEDNSVLLKSLSKL